MLIKAELAHHSILLLILYLLSLPYYLLDRIKQINIKLTYTIPVSCGLLVCYPENPLCATLAENP